MRAYRIKHDFDKSQPRWDSAKIALHGKHNEGAVVSAESAARAIHIFAERHHMNPWFFKAVEA